MRWLRPAFWSAASTSSLLLVSTGSGKDSASRSVPPGHTGHFWNENHAVGGRQPYLAAAAGPEPCKRLEQQLCLQVHIMVAVDHHLLAGSDRDIRLADGKAAAQIDLFAELGGDHEILGGSAYPRYPRR